MKRPVVERVLRKMAFARDKHLLEHDFARVIASGEALDLGRNSGPVVGVATLASGGWHCAIEALLAHALARRGARPELLVCDLPGLPICSERRRTARERDRCAGCIDDKRAVLDSAGLPWRPLSSLIATDSLARAFDVTAALDPAEFHDYRERGWPIGQWLHVSVSHYLGCDGGGNTPAIVDARRRLLTSAIVWVEAVERWLDVVRPDIVIVQGGAHLEWRIVLELARARGVSVTCREMGKGGWDYHIYALDRDVMSPDLGREWAIGRERRLSPVEESAVDAFLRELPARTYRQVNDPAADHSSRAVPGIPQGKRTAVAFTNVTWDLATAGRDVAFAGVADWLGETIRIFSGMPDVHLLVRAHPAEVGVDSEERVLDRLATERPDSIPNVTLVPPESRVSARSLFDRADLVVAYNSTAGLEAAAAGRPVLVCGDPHYRGKGFTRDVSSRSEYADLLAAWANGAPPAVAHDTAELARRYVHLFFLRYHIKMGWTTSPLEPPFALTIRSLQELLPGANAALDAVCEGILERRQIVLRRPAAAEVA
ncbi:MAG TPA: hypothetical protein VEA16_18610 [Vicinamibacterales bacterium]|nr:hypothetical protein [Vicinamibacterales bacterium]